MNATALQQLIDNPRPLLDTLRAPRGTAFRRSNLFRRDIQFGLWRYLNRDQTKCPYHVMEALSEVLIQGWIARGVVREIGRQTYELLLEGYETPGSGMQAEPPGATSKTSTGADHGHSQTPDKPVDTSKSSDDEKQRRTEALRQKMTEAKASRASGSGRSLEQ